MKHKGSRCDFNEERDKDLLRAYRHELGRCDTIDIDDVVRSVVMSPSKRFWVSEDRATIVISDMLKGKSIYDMIPCKRAMYQEIFSRVCKIRASNPNTILSKVVEEVVHQPAPQFYLTEGSAKVIISKAKKKTWLQRIGHWFI